MQPHLLLSDAYRSYSKRGSTPTSCTSVRKSKHRTIVTASKLTDGVVDLKNEKIIILMIAIEIVLSFVAIGLAISSDRHQSRDVERQLAESRAIETNLQNLQKSSSATADSLVSVKDILSTMKISLDKQVALFYDVQLNMIYDEGKKEIGANK
jgi:hypothetical protein